MYVWPGTTFSVCLSVRRKSVAHDYILSKPCTRGKSNLQRFTSDIQKTGGSYASCRREGSAVCPVSDKFWSTTLMFRLTDYPRHHSQLKIRMLQFITFTELPLRASVTLWAKKIIPQPLLWILNIIIAALAFLILYLLLWNHQYFICYSDFLNNKAATLAFLKQHVLTWHSYYCTNVTHMTIFYVTAAFQTYMIISCVTRLIVFFLRFTHVPVLHKIL